MLERAYRDRHARHLDVDGPGLKLTVRQDALETLDDIQIPELCRDKRSFAAVQQRSNGALRAEQRLSQLDVATKFGHDMGEPVEVFRGRIGHDVAILRSADDAPRPQRQASNNDEANIGLDNADEKLVERRRAQRTRRAESRNSNSLRVNEIVSLRFTTSGRCPSARRRSRRTRSPSGSSGCRSRRSAIDLNVTEPIAETEAGGGAPEQAAAAHLANTGIAGKSSKSPWPLIRRLHEERFGSRAD